MFSAPGAIQRWIIKRPLCIAVPSDVSSEPIESLDSHSMVQPGQPEICCERWSKLSLRPAAFSQQLSLSVCSIPSESRADQRWLGGYQLESIKCLLLSLRLLYIQSSRSTCGMCRYRLTERLPQRLRFSCFLRNPNPSRRALSGRLQIWYISTWETHSQRRSRIDLICIANRLHDSDATSRAIEHLRFLSMSILGLMTRPCICFSYVAG